MILFRCQECGKKLKAEPEIIGRKVQCTRCDNVERVPKVTNLTKPKTKPKTKPDSKSKKNPSSKRLETTKPKVKPASFKARAGEEPVELFGHSAATDIDTSGFEPKFNVAAPKKSNFKRNLILGLVAASLLIGVTVVLNLDRIRNASRQLSTDYENLEEVKYYRNAVAKLKRSKLVMSIAAKNYVMTKSPSDEEKKEIEDFEASIDAMTETSDVIKEVEQLYRSGKDIKASALLVNSGSALNDVRAKVDAKAKEYSDKAY